jgi:osmotically-inducible protein OsmY
MLQGQVATAEHLASRVRGVRQVKNELGVRQRHSQYVYSSYLEEQEPLIAGRSYLATEPSKAERGLRDAIAERLRWSPLVDADQIRVVVNAAMVTLEGTVDSHGERRAAVENAFEAGATVVRNHLQLRKRPEGHPRGLRP